VTAAQASEAVDLLIVAPSPLEGRIGDSYVGATALSSTGSDAYPDGVTACVTSCFEVLVSVTGALPRPAASELFVECSGLKLCGWALGCTARASRDALSDGKQRDPGDETVASAGSPFWSRIGALSSALVLNVVTDCPSLHATANRELAAAGGVSFLRESLAHIPETERMLRMFQVAPAAPPSGDGNVRSR
jgi:hypothetical protein